jgi:transcriptional regulator with XRE-family HTH domain
MDTPGTDYKARVAQGSVVLVRRVLAERGWRPARLAEELVVHPDLVRRWLRGERRPQLDDMLHMADMVQASLDELLGLKDPNAGVELSQEQVDELAELTASKLIGYFAGALAGAASVAESSRSADELALRPLPADTRNQLSTRARQALDKLVGLDDDSRIRRRLGA